MKERNEKIIVPRAPIVVIMGHIDHGKSTLLDFIRHTNITKDEAGGITQHLGAYEATYKDNTGKEHKLTFLDTPGHEAFSGIRERGAEVADVAVLVVSAEDGVKPQTLEALKCLRDSETPFVVAINKIDKPSANIEKTKQNLAENEIYIEGYGGSIPWVPVSGLTGQGVPELLDILTLMAEMEELVGDSSLPAQGAIIETHVDSKKGMSATLVVKDGTLKVGDVVVADYSYCPVRAIENFTGKHVKEIVLGSPARIVGWNRLPPVGAKFMTVASKKEAEKMTESFIENKASLSTNKKSAAGETVPTNLAIIPVLIKADTAGSLEAIMHEIEKIKIEGVEPKIIGSSVGTISENDVKIASSTIKPFVIGFNVKTDEQAKISAERMSIEIISFDLIYKLTEWFQSVCQLRKPQIEVEEQTGKAKILKIFSTEKGKFVIGGRVESGSIKNGAFLKLLRREAEIGKGKIRSLQQLKSKIDEAKKDTEFGAMIESKIEPMPGDRIEAFITVVK